MEWKHAAWPESRQGRCKGCMRRSQKHIWHCVGCDETKPVPQYSSERLKGRLRQRRRPGARCNYCTRKAKEEQEEQQNKSASIVVKSSDPTSAAVAAPAMNVQIWCEHCMSAKLLISHFSGVTMGNADFVTHTACPAIQ